MLFPVTLLREQHSLQTWKCGCWIITQENTRRGERGRERKKEREGAMGERKRVRDRGRERE